MERKKIIDEIPIKSVREVLIFSEKLIEDFKKDEGSLNATEIFNRYAEAVEIILHQKISNCFRVHIDEEYGDNFIHNKDIRIKFGSLQNDKRIPLNLWEIIIDDFEQDTIQEDLKPFKECLDKKADEITKNLIKEASKFIAPLLNPSTLNIRLTRAEVDYHIDKIFQIINQMISILY